MYLKATILILLNFFINLQLKAQPTVRPVAFEVKSEYLQNGKILINNSLPTTTIKFDVTFAKGTGYSKTRLVTFIGQSLTPFSNKVTVSSSDFGVNDIFITKTYEVIIQKNLLSGQPIYLGVETSFNSLEQLYQKSYQYIIPPQLPQITINAVNKVETILFGTNCGFQHAYGVSYNPVGHMEKDVWKFAYDISYTKNNANLSDSDIFWEWDVADMSNIMIGEKQFVVYPYGGNKSDVLSGQKKVMVEANDYLDEYDSRVKVRAKSRSTGAILSSYYNFWFTAVNH